MYKTIDSCGIPLRHARMVQSRSSHHASSDSETTVNPTRIAGEMGSQCFELCTITCLFWHSDDVRMNKTTQSSELRFVHRKLTRIGSYLGTRQTPMKSQGTPQEGAVLIERFLRNPYPNAPQGCGCHGPVFKQAIPGNGFVPPDPKSEASGVCRAIPSPVRPESIVFCCGTPNPRAIAA